MLTTVSLTRRFNSHEKTLQNPEAKSTSRIRIRRVPWNSNKKTQIPPVSAVKFQQQAQEKHYRQEKKKEATCDN
jgi:hypothetical protein